MAYDRKTYGTSPFAQPVRSSSATTTASKRRRGLADNTEALSDHGEAISPSSASERAPSKPIPTATNSKESRNEISN